MVSGWAQRSLDTLLNDSVLTTPANVASYLAKGFVVIQAHVPGKFGEQLVRMERPSQDTEPSTTKETTPKGSD